MVDKPALYTRSLGGPSVTEGGSTCGPYMDAQTDQMMVIIDTCQSCFDVRQILTNQIVIRHV